MEVILTGMSPSDQDQALCEAVRLLADRCPRLARSCYWAGTSCISLEELQKEFGDSFEIV